MLYERLILILAVKLIIYQPKYCRVKKFNVEWGIIEEKALSCLYVAYTY